MAEIGTYLKKHTEALVKDVGIEAACQITGKSKATLGRYYSDNAEHADRFMPVDAVAKLESAASYPHVTSALADLKNITLSYNGNGSAEETGRSGGVNSDVIALSQRFAQLMCEYQARDGRRHHHRERGQAPAARNGAAAAGAAGYEAASGRRKCLTALDLSDLPGIAADQLHPE